MKSNALSTLEGLLKKEESLEKKFNKQIQSIEKMIEVSQESQRELHVKIHEEKRKNSIHKKNDNELIKMLSKGVTFKMTKSISRYKNWHSGTKWNDAEVGEHFCNKDSQVTMYVPKWRTLGYPDLQEFVEEYNDGLWEEIKK